MKNFFFALLFALVGPTWGWSQSSTPGVSYTAFEVGVAGVANLQTVDKKQVPILQGVPLNIARFIQFFGKDPKTFGLFARPTLGGPVQLFINRKDGSLEGRYLAGTMVPTSLSVDIAKGQATGILSLQLSTSESPLSELTGLASGMIGFTFSPVQGPTIKSGSFSIIGATSIPQGAPTDIVCNFTLTFGKAIPFTPSSQDTQSSAN